MASDGIDKWIEKHPEWWAEQAEQQTTSNTANKTQFKKLLKKGLTKQNKQSLLKYINNANLNTIYNKSKFANKKSIGASPIIPKEKPRLKKITIKRKNKTYTKLTGQRWDKKYAISLKIAAQEKPRTPEYKEYVNRIVESTGRSRQAVIKKIQRTRKTI